MLRRVLFYSLIASLVTAMAYVGVYLYLQNRQEPDLVKRYGQRYHISNLGQPIENENTSNTHSFPGAYLEAIEMAFKDYIPRVKRKQPAIVRSHRKNDTPFENIEDYSVLIKSRRNSKIIFVMFHLSTVRICGPDEWYEIDLDEMRIVNRPIIVPVTEDIAALDETESGSQYSLSVLADNPNPNLIGLLWIKYDYNIAGRLDERQAEIEELCEEAGLRSVGNDAVARSKLEKEILRILRQKYGEEAIIRVSFNY